MHLKSSEGYWQLFWKCPKRIGDLFSSAYKVAEILSPYKSRDPMGAFPSGSPANKKQGNPLILMLTMYPHISGIFCLFPQSTAVLLNLNTI
jgi:hypothetical protein